MRLWGVVLLIGLAVGHAKAAGQQSNEVVSRIAFGSCGQEDRTQPVLLTAARHEPGLFVFLGDNIHGDTYDMVVLRAKYAKLNAKPEFQWLWLKTRVLATWDDHDFGWNDAGRHYPYRAESREIFMDFWREPQNSERRRREGIYARSQSEQGTHRGRGRAENTGTVGSGGRQWWKRRFPARLSRSLLPLQRDGRFHPGRPEGGCEAGQGGRDTESDAHQRVGREVQ